MTCIAYLILMVNELLDAPKSGLIGIGVMVVSAGVYYYFKKKNGGKEYQGEGIE